jgi:protein-disulfide isomerase
MGKDRVGSSKGKRPGVVKGARTGSNRGFYIALAVMAIAGIAALSYLATRSSASSRVTEVDPTLPPVEAVGYVIGDSAAPVEVLEFADWECGACAQFATITAPDVKQRLVETGQIRLRIMDVPWHTNSWTASLAAACANDQGKFWEMHDALYNTQDRWNTLATDNPLKPILEAAGGAGIDTDRLEACVEARTHQAAVQSHLKAAESRGVRATPTFIIGGKVIPGAIGYDRFKAYVDTALVTAQASPATAASPAAAPAAAVPVVDEHGH